MTEPAPVSRLVAVRRADFRFLLPDPAPRSVSVVGPADRALTEAFEAVGGVELAGDLAAADLTVACRPSAADLGPALQRPHGSGWWWVEVQGGLIPGRRSRSGLGAAAVLRQLRRAGRRAEPYLLWPTAASTKEIFPLRDPGARRLSLSRRQASRGARVKAWMADVALREPAGLRLAPHVGVLVHPDPAAPGESTNEGHGTLLGTAGHLLEARGAELGVAEHGIHGPLSGVLVTPRFGASRHVVALLTDRGSEGIRLVAKIPRLRHDHAGISHEAEALRQAFTAGLAPGGAPTPVWVGDHQGWPVLVETALTGTSLGPRRAGSAPDHWAEAAVRWALSLVAPASIADQGVFTRLVHDPLQEWARITGDPDGLVARTGPIVATLDGAELPGAIEHGDLSHPNVFAVAGDRIGAVDWEVAETRGLPAHDVTFFLGYLAGARRGLDLGHDPVATARAVGDDLWASQGWAVGHLHRYASAAGVRPEHLPGLVVASWARMAAGLVRRLAVESAPPPAAVLLDHRHTRAWARVVAMAEAGALVVRT